MIIRFLVETTTLWRDSSYKFKPAHRLKASRRRLRPGSHRRLRLAVKRRMDNVIMPASSQSGAVQLGFVSKHRNTAVSAVPAARETRLTQPRQGHSFSQIRVLRRVPGLVLLFLLCWFPLARAPADEVDTLLQTIANAGPQGAGSAAARVASVQLKSRGVEILPQLLDALDSPNIVAANWYRTIYEEIITREAAKPQPEFPVELLQSFARDSQRQGRARRMVLRRLDDLTPGYRDSILPSLLDDAEFRTDAVAFVLRRGDKAKAVGDIESAVSDFRVAFKHAREISQVTGSADRLKASGIDVNIVEQMGFVTRWFLLGPFDAPARSGFDTSFPPERAVDLAANYVGKDGADIQWQLFETDDRLGQLNLINAIAPVKESVGYAYILLHSLIDQTVQLRCGADDNLSVWLNGEKILARRQWLNGTRLDRFTAAASFKQGTNKVLVKICQGPQHKNPAVPNNWSMQLRFCDSTGTGVGLRSILPEIDE